MTDFVIPPNATRCTVRTGDERFLYAENLDPHQARAAVLSGAYGVGVFRLDYMDDQWMLDYELLNIVPPNTALTVSEPIASEPPATQVFSNRIYSWALETKIVGIVNEASIDEAAMQFRTSGRVKDRFVAWLLDASEMTKFSFDAVDAIKNHVMDLSAMGLEKFALILPPEDMHNIPAIQMMMQDIMPVYPFETREDAMAWLRRRCR